MMLPETIKIKLLITLINIPNTFPIKNNADAMTMNPIPAIRTNRPVNGLSIILVIISFTHMADKNVPGLFQHACVL